MKKKCDCDEKIIRYKNGIAIAKELSKKNMPILIIIMIKYQRFEKILKFYQNLKVWNELSKS